MKKLFVILILSVSVVGVLFFLFHPKETEVHPSKDKDSFTLPIRTLKSQSFTYTRYFIGSVEPIQSVVIVPYLSAFLKEVRVRSGAEVTKGDILFLLDDKIPLADLNQAKEAVGQAAAKCENAKIYYERMKKTDIKAISPIDLEQAKTEYESAEAAYQKAMAAQNQAQTIYDYTVIKAPISGWVGDVTATVGEYLSPNTVSLATIVGFSPVRLVFSVPLSVYNSNDFLKKNTSLQVVLSNRHVLEFQDFQLVRSNRANKLTDSLSFFIDVPNDTKYLIPGAYVEIRFLSQEQGILVDKDDITLTSEGAEVVVLKNGRIEKRKVEIKEPIGMQYWIKSGLSEGEDIITVPVSSSQIGQAAKGISS